MSRSVRRGSFANGVYAAEFDVFERSPRRSVTEPMGLADARALIEKYAPDVVVERTERTTARDTHGHYTPGSPSVISLARGAPRWVVVHEIAHAMTWERERGHGAIFRREYLVLVERELGPWWARRLRAAFRRVGYGE